MRQVTGLVKPAMRDQTWRIRPAIPLLWTFV